MRDYTYAINSRKINIERKTFVQFERLVPFLYSALEVFTIFLQHNDLSILLQLRVYFPYFMTFKLQKPFQNVKNPKPN